MRPVKAYVILLAGGLFAHTETVAWAGCIAPQAGQGPPSLHCLFGVEQWEGPKRSELRYQQWALNCETPAHAKTSCTLKRDIFTVWPTEFGGMTAAHDDHSTDDGTLRLVDDRWREGRLDFDAVTASWQQDIIHVTMRLTVDDPVVTLRSFKGIHVGRSLFSDELSTVEYRVPEYTYTVSLPVTLQGVKSEADKRRDVALNGLSADDRRVWEAVRSKCTLFDKLDWTQLPVDLRRKVETTESSNLTPEEKARLMTATKKVVGADFGKCLRDGGMSKSGSEGLVTHLLAEFDQF